MLRASAVCEAAGIPSATLVSQGFIVQAAASSVGLGLPKMPVAMIPGHPDTQSIEELRKNIRNVTVDRIIDILMKGGTLDALDAEPDAREIVYGMPYKEWQAKHQKEATAEQKAAFAKANPGH